MAINGASDYMQKYKYALDYTPKDVSNDLINPEPNKIWTAWLQGLEYAPEIIQKCIATLQKRYGDDVIILTNENIPKFLDIPHFITEKYKKGIISNTHYSDIIRFFIIEKYGGLWLDGTTFLLDDIPDYIRFADIFFYTNPNKKIMCSIGVIAAKPHHPVIVKIISLLLEYWKNENRTIIYSITMICIAMVIHSSLEMEAEWSAIPNVPVTNKTLLLQQLFDKYDAKHVEIMKQISVIQQLSWKSPKENYEIQGTFYDELVKKS